MWDYFSMIFWVIIAVTGLVLYTNPSLWVRHMYEGFNTQQQAAQTQQTQQTQQPQTQQQQQQPPTNVNSVLRNLEQLIGTPGNIPDVQPVMPSPASTTQHQSNTGRQQPQEADGKSSLPQPVNQPQGASKALEQRKSFQQTLPKTETADKEIIKERIVEVPVPRTCPRQEACPTCPDMQQYIRKDSIPCWACKL